MHRCFVESVDINCTVTEKMIEICNVIRNEKIFGSCIKALNETTVSEYFESCKMDVCSYDKDKMHIHSVACKSYEGFAEECEKAGIITNWRRKVSCSM